MIDFISKVKVLGSNKNVFLSFSLVLICSFNIAFSELPESGNINVNAEAKCSFRETFSIYRWNLNIISAHDYAKIFLLKTDTSVPKFDIIRLL